MVLRLIHAGWVLVADDQVDVEYGTALRASQAGRRFGSKGAGSVPTALSKIRALTVGGAFGRAGGKVTATGAGR